MRIRLVLPSNYPMSPFSPLQQLHRLETSSSQFPAQITSILDGTEYNVWIQNLQEGDLPQIVEYLDNVYLCITLTAFLYSTST